MKIKNKDTNEQTLIVAEIGNNHEGDFSLAKEMVKQAAACGVDAVKFQTFDTDHYVQRKETERYNRLKSFELTHDEFAELAQYAHSLDTLFISTPFDLGSAVFLETIVDAYKIASGDITFLPLLNCVAETSKPVILSTGASSIDQIQIAFDLLSKGIEPKCIHDQIGVLHCVSSYPAPIEDVNLKAIMTLKHQFPATIGLSDHTIGAEASILSVALGAQIIEKHFTLDKNYSDFRDHQLSADPPEMKRIVESIRRAELLLGNEKKELQGCEEGVVNAIRRSIAVSRDLDAGEVLSSTDLTWLRPATGIAPGNESLFIGKTLKKSINCGEFISTEDIE